MAGYRNGYIQLVSPREVFYPGQVVLGSVVLELDQPLTLSVLYVNYLGEATVNWNEQESEEVNGVKRRNTIEYAGREEYFNVTQVLAGGHTPINLPPGTHTYQFNYQVPTGVPSSFSGERGDVEYSINANIELRGQTEIKEQLTKHFEVVAPFNLNLGTPEFKDPIEMEFEETYGCGCFCSSDPVNIRIRLPVSGYCPGQVIPVALEVDNNTSVEIRKMIFEIITRERYRTQRPVSEYIPPEQTIATVKRGAIMSGSKRSVQLDVPLPAIIVPNLDNCGIIDVGYFFRVTIKLSGCSDDLQDEAEIRLGLVPLAETVEGEYIHPLSQSLPIGPIPDISYEERQQESQAYPNQVPPNAGFAYPMPPNVPGNVQTSYVVQYQEQSFSSTDPSQNYKIGFTMTSPPQMNNFQQGWPAPSYPGSDLKIHLPPPAVNVNIPTAPPPSS